MPFCGLLKFLLELNCLLSGTLDSSYAKNNFDSEQPFYVWTATEFSET
jgi:hypothetical protein